MVVVNCVGCAMYAAWYRLKAVSFGAHPMKDRERKSARA